MNGVLEVGLDAFIDLQGFLVVEIRNFEPPQQFVAVAAVAVRDGEVPMAVPTQGFINVDRVVVGLIGLLVLAPVKIRLSQVVVDYCEAGVILAKQVLENRNRLVVKSLKLSRTLV